MPERRLGNGISHRAGGELWNPGSPTVSTQEANRLIGTHAKWIAAGAGYYDTVVGDRLI